jgi:hypothetical protein
LCVLARKPFSLTLYRNNLFDDFELFYVLARKLFSLTLLRNNLFNVFELLYVLARKPFSQFQFNHLFFISSFAISHLHSCRALCFGPSILLRAFGRSSFELLCCFLFQEFLMIPVSVFLFFGSPCIYYVLI